MFFYACNERMMEVAAPKKRAKPMEMCLCGRCREQFNSPAYRIKRADPYQTTKDTCTFCNFRSGYDYLVYDRDAS